MSPLDMFFLYLLIRMASSSPDLQIATKGCALQFNEDCCQLKVCHEILKCIYFSLFSFSNLCWNFDTSVFVIVQLLIFRELKDLDQDSMFHVDPIDEGCFQQLLNYKATILDKQFDWVLHARNALFRSVPFLLSLFSGFVDFLNMHDSYIFLVRFNKELLEVIESHITQVTSNLCRMCNPEALANLDKLEHHSQQLTCLIEDVLCSL